ncbi:MAG: dihydrolipoyl dehydrogenase family protein [Streptosporangiaceae bacterium]
MAEHVDVVVIGMGVGGEEAAGSLAEAGLSVVGVEANLLGGECPYWACIPSKMMLRAAELLAEGRRIPGMAGDSAVTPEWKPVARRIRDEATDNWNDRAAVDRFEGQGGRFVRGRARITAPGEVTVGELVFEAGRGVIIANGTTPAVPPLRGLADTPYWTNHEAIETEAVPASLIVLGAGAVGVELAQVFARFGAEVTLVEMADHVLPGEEPEASEVLARALAGDGIAVRAGAQATNVAYDGSFTVTLDDGAQVSGERLLVATGRHAHLAALGVGAVGLDEEAGAVPVDARLRAAPGVWAIGDVTGKGAFTHVAVYQARIAARDVLGQAGPEADYRAVPRVTFTDPEVGGVGLTEQQARDQGLRVRTGTSQVGSSARGWIHKAGGDGVIKLVEDADRGVLVGATSAGPMGGEVLSMLILAVHERVPTEHLRGMIYAFPAFHRAVEDALGNLRTPP